MTPPRISALGEAALLLRWRATVPTPALAEEVRAVWSAVSRARIGGVVDVVPGPASLLVRFDPMRSSLAEVRDRLKTLSVRPPVTATRPREHRIGIVYDGADLHVVCQMLELLPDELVELHSRPSYTVLATGFAPGFVYLGPVHSRLRLARRDAPRRRVPAGSVGLAASQTGIYGVPSSGGWWLVGTADSGAFDPGRRPPSPFSIGDRVRFVVLGR